MERLGILGGRRVVFHLDPRIMGASLLSPEEGKGKNADSQPAGQSLCP
jgi:hypothetical protein